MPAVPTDPLLAAGVRWCSAVSGCFRLQPWLKHVLVRPYTRSWVLLASGESTAGDGAWKRLADGKSLCAMLESQFVFFFFCEAGLAKQG